MDKWDEKAAQLVSHCRYCDRDYKCPDDLAQDRADVAAALREQGAEIGRLKGRNADDPVARLHNICDALKDDAAESPFSKDEWNRMDAENVRLTKEIAALKAEVERLRIENASLTTAQPGAEQNYYFMLQGAKQEITKLKAQLAAARRINEQLMAGNDRMEAQLAEAEKRGMETILGMLSVDLAEDIRAAMEGK